MKITFKDLDFWLAKGFGGIINILHERCTKFSQGWGQKARSLIEIETRRLAELNDAVQASQVETEYINTPPTDMVCLDYWFVKAFIGLDKYLGERSKEGPTPISEENLKEMEQHCMRLMHIVETERKKCQRSGGKPAASTTPGKT